jgi:hypothetical protein
MKKRDCEPGVTNFENYYGSIEKVADQNPDSIPDAEILIQDIMIGCVQGTLLCLERKQRLVFILAVVFNITDKMGAEILEISRSNYRKILSRARKKLFHYMHGNCGVVNPDNPCKCRNKLKGFMELGSHTPEKIVYHEKGAPAIQDIISKGQKGRRELTQNIMSRFTHTIYAEYTRLFRSHPFYTSPDLTAWLRKTLDRKDFKEIFNFE